MNAWDQTGTSLSTIHWRAGGTGGDGGAYRSGGAETENNTPLQTLRVWAGGKNGSN